ncbi:hypothetical protein CERSUDRAFT_95491 [Gelatoporia subvermispora B]|uniref:Uncharacterized protein n=1 Tax=Ceriporiopsis subvermispora (strain B) TaxID=914234 RepID=M2QYK0_CERS8|nr:hypothetical protein CERSUDRAFT_95491 [Gelatoporia subvermispora B]
MAEQQLLNATLNALLREMQNLADTLPEPDSNAPVPNNTDVGGGDLDADLNALLQGVHELATVDPPAPPAAPNPGNAGAQDINASLNAFLQGIFDLNTVDISDWSLEKCSEVMDGFTGVGPFGGVFGYQLFFRVTMRYSDLLAEKAAAVGHSAVHNVEADEPAGERQAQEEKEEPERPQQPDTMRLPLELVFEIAEHALVDPDTARAVTQVCYALRKLTLPAAYRVLPQMSTIERFLALPRHLHPFVRNIWINPTAAALTKDQVFASSWVWLTAAEIAVPHEYIWAAPVFTRVAPPARAACTRLTLLASPHPPRTGHIVRDALSAVAELRLAELRTELSMLISEFTPALRRIALSTRPDELLLHIYRADIAVRMCRNPVPPSVVFVVPRDTDPERVMRDAEMCRKHNKNLHLAPGGVTNEEIREEWERKDDIWAAAEAIREAALKSDLEEVKRVCSVRGPWPERPRVEDLDA